ncbi:type II toxin-antitoxin system RelB/DinJ family antitoxin [Gluconobacter oxydans]|uniref:type II toxin-antitoxin system RelB/DinJ family antitoxin n=2 Tax=Gluconobacter oxydans TaxID=442 RepID=UPI0039E9AF92
MKSNLIPVDSSSLLASEDEQASLMKDALASGDEAIIVRARMMIDEAKGKHMNDDGKEDVTFFVSEEEKKAFLEVCEQDGVTPSEALEEFFQYIVDNKALPPALVEFQKQKSAGQR